MGLECEKVSHLIEDILKVRNLINIDSKVEFDLDLMN